MKHIKRELNQDIMHQSQNRKSQSHFLYKMNSKKNSLKKDFIDNDDKEKSKAFERRKLSD